MADLTLSSHPEECGWLKDKIGVSWQIVPIVLIRMLQDNDRERPQRLMKAMMQMKKLDITGLEKTYQRQ